jgi:peptidoglycan/xylan/chitin deacetylase (PgdA/CDA1 family)
MMLLALGGCGESGAAAGAPGGSTAGGNSSVAGSTTGGSASGGEQGGTATAGKANGGAGQTTGGANGGSAGVAIAGSGGTGGGAPACSPGDFSWPNGAVAAVSITYDDSLESQVSFAVPVLDANGLQATFFLSNSYYFMTMGAKFGELVAKGHELASHTLAHPCDPDLAGYTDQTMAKELDDGIAAVQALGQAGKLTFAYPCGQSNFGTPAKSYEPLVKERFAAARGTTWAVADPKTVDLFNVPSAFPPTTSDGSDFLALVQDAEESGGWAVLGVHGVSAAGEYLQFTQPAHDAVAKYLKDNAGKIWTAPFGTVAAHVAACR